MRPAPSFAAWLFPQDLLDAVPAALAVLCDGVVVQANPAMADLVGSDPTGARLDVALPAGALDALVRRPLAGTPAGGGAVMEVVTACSTQATCTAARPNEAELQYRSIFENAQEGIYQTTPDGRYLRVNPALARIYGYDSPAALIAGLTDIAGQLYVNSADRDRFRVLLERDGVVRDFEAPIHRRDGAVIWITENARCVRDADGAVAYYEGTVEDITDRKRAEAEIRFHAFYDPVTSLPNRRMVLDHLGAALADTQQNGTRGCLLFLDLDRFKAVNDSHGHTAGDELLRLVGRRLKHCVKPTDLIGRLGSDEFVILLADCGPGNPGAYVAEKVLYTMSEPFALQGAEHFCMPTIGIAYFPDHAAEVEAVLNNADTALCHARKGRERRYATFEPGMTRRDRDRLNLENDLHMAAARGELELHYQPKVDAATLAVVGAEALLRWRHPTHGMISPAQFIPLAEETGLILSIGRWVLRRACLQLGRWREKGLTLPSLSVNVSALQFNDPTFADMVQAVLEETNIPAPLLDLEITESAMAEDMDRALNTLQGLKDRGVTLSIDDFGTGYSSLNQLKRLPIDTLKIDQTFVRDVVTERRDAAVATTIITLAKHLDFAVVAEGVETQEQAEFLHARGCGQLQGYWISRPLPAADFAEFLGRRRKG